MSYIRMSSEGRYCNLGDSGSKVYAFGKSGRIVNQGYGKTINQQEMAGVITSVLKEVDIKIDGLNKALEKEFGGISDIKEYPYPRPETGEIVCRILNRKLDIDIEPSVFDRISLAFQPTFRECDFCGDRTRVVGPDGIVSCEKEECRARKQDEIDRAVAEKLGYDDVDAFRQKDPHAR